MINRLFKKFLKLKQLAFKRCLFTTVPSLLLLIATAVMLAWFVNFESSNFYKAQQDLATGTVKGITHNLSQLVSQRRQIVTSMVEDYRELLIEIADFPADHDNLNILKSAVKNRLPDHFTYVITDSEGKPLLEEKILKLGSQCKSGLKLFSGHPDRHYETVVMHGETPDDYHFDVMVDINSQKNSPIFFVSFRIAALLELLKNSQISGQSLLVVNNAKSGQIELSAAGVFKSDWHGKFLTDGMKEKVLYEQSVPGTGWSILSLPDLDLFSIYHNKLLYRSAFVFFLLLSVLIIFLWRLWLEENSRLLAEQSLKRSNDELEQKVEQRTQELARKELDLQKTFMSAPYGMLVINGQGVIELINKRAEEIFGYSENELLNQSMNILLPENVSQIHDKLRVGFKSSQESRVMGSGRHLMGRKKNESEIAIEIGLSSLDHSEGNKVIASITDVSELILAQKKLKEEHERAVITLSSIGDGVITTDIDGEIDSINPVAEKLSGWQAEDAIGRHISQVFMVVNEKTGKKVEDPVIQCLHNKAIVELGTDTVLIHRHGMEIPIEDSAAPILSADGMIIGAVLVFHDVSQSRAHANEIEFQANHDALTGLLNRREFDRRLNKAVDKARETGSENNLIFLDLDHFKKVNDSAGHAAGDELLKQVTKLMSAQLRQRDTFARLGGDEFAILLELSSKQIGLRVADKLRSLIQDFRFFSGGQVFKIGVSIGVAPFSKSVGTADNVLRDADSACYMAKESGRNRVQIYDNSVEQKRRKKLKSSAISEYG